MIEPQSVVGGCERDRCLPHLHVGGGVAVGAEHAVVVEHVVAVAVLAQVEVLDACSTLTERDERKNSVGELAIIKGSSSFYKTARIVVRELHTFEALT